MQDKPPLLTGFDPSSFRQETLLLLLSVVEVTLHIILTPKAALQLTEALTKRLVPAWVQLAALVGLAAGKLPYHQLPSCVCEHGQTQPSHPLFSGWEVRKQTKDKQSISFFTVMLKWQVMYLNFRTEMLLPFPPTSLQQQSWSRIPPALFYWWLTLPLRFLARSSV